MPVAAKRDPLAGFSEEERGGIIRGEALPSRRSQAPARWICDDSGDGRECEGLRFGREAVVVFERLKERGGSARLSEVQAGITGPLRLFVRDGIADLERLAVVHQEPDRFGRPDPVLVLESGWEDLGLSSGWSRAGW